MVHLSYSYKGRPIAPYGKRRFRHQGGSPRRKGFALLAAAVCVLALVVFCVKLFSGGEEANEESSAREERSEDPPVPVELTDSRKTEAAIPPLPRTSDKPPSAHERKLNDMYRRALSEYDAGQYVAARKTLREVFETLSPHSPLFDKCARLLNRSNRLLRESADGDPELNADYTVRKGDTLSGIALAYNTKAADIRKANGLRSDRLHIGQKLRIPRKTWSIRILRGSNHLILYGKGRLYNIYRVLPGTHVPASLSGRYSIVIKEENPVWTSEHNRYAPGSPHNFLGPRKLCLNPIRSGKDDLRGSTAIHGNNREGDPDPSPGAPGYFRMRNDDVKELYDIVPRGTEVDIVSPR